MVNRRTWFRHSSTKGGAVLRPFQVGSRAGTVHVDRPPEPEPAADGGGDAQQARPPRRLLFINQYYWPDEASTAQHLADLAGSLAALGYECHVLCSQGSYKPGEPRLPIREVHDGVHIHRVPATALGRRGTFSRMTDYLSYYAGALFQATVLPRFDIVITLTTPPLIGLVGTLLKRLKGSRHISWTMDLHPDASLALNRMSPRSLFGRLMSRISKLIYRRADKVVVLGPYMADRMAEKNVPHDRITTIPVWSRRDEIYPTPRAANPLRKSLGIGPAFVAMYSGNLGLAHSFDEFLDAARRLRDRRDILFLFVGGGPRTSEVKAVLENEGLPNIRMLDSVPRGSLHISLSLADAHLISMRPEMTGIVVPGKLYGAMAAGRPAIFVGPEHCETADAIKSAGCGVTVAPGDVESLVAALELLASDPSVCRRMGEKARSAFLTHFEQKLCCLQWSRLVHEIGSHPEVQRPQEVTRFLYDEPVASASGRVSTGILNHSGHRTASGPFIRDHLAWSTRFRGSTI
jgi:colanic acid biosynthesis glycosyl transferase WcaI